MAFDDVPTPAHLTRGSQGQRCASCGHLEPDQWARFCGVCGAALGGGAAPAGGPGAPIQAATQQPPARYAPAAPPAQPYVGGPIGVADRPQPITYTIPSVGFAGPARIGAAVAAAFTLLPCVLFGFLGAWAVHAGRKLLESWLSASVRVPVPLVSVDLNMNFIELLKLRSVFDVFIYWDDRLWLTFALLWLAPWAVWIIAGALFGVILAAVYNLIGKLGGGVRVTMEPTASGAGRPVVSSTVWPQGSASGAPAAWPGPPEPRR